MPHRIIHVINSYNDLKLRAKKLNVDLSKLPEDDLKHFNNEAGAAISSFLEPKSKAFDDYRKLEGKNLKIHELASELFKLSQRVSFENHLALDKKDSDTISPKLIFYFSGLIIAGSLCLILYVLMISGNALFQYRITISLICFVLSSISALLFAVKADLSGKFGIISFSVFGPGVMWLIALIVMYQIFPEKDLNTSNELDVIKSKNFHSLIKKEEWINYNDWKNEISDCKKIEEQNEEHTIADFLPRVFYKGRYTSKLNSPKINSLFIYNIESKTAIKFQNITGDKTPNGEAPWIYLSGTPSTPNGLTNSFYLYMNNKSIASIDSSMHGEWKQIPTNPVDVMLISIYLNESTPEGDYIFVDIPKYLNKNSSPCSYTLSVLSDKNVMPERYLDEIAADPDMSEAESNVPVLFKAIRGNDKDPEGIMKDYSDWFKAIDTYMEKNKGDDAKKLQDKLSQAFHTKGPIKLNEYFNSTDTKNKYKGKFKYSSKSEFALINIFRFEQ